MDKELEYMQSTMNYLKLIATNANNHRNDAVAHKPEVFFETADFARDLIGSWHGYNRQITEIAEGLEKVSVDLHWKYDSTKASSVFDEMKDNIERRCGQIFKILLDAMQPKTKDMQLMGYTQAVYETYIFSRTRR